MPPRVKEKSASVGNARIVFAPHPSARSRPCPCPGGSTPRYPAQPRPPSRTLKPVTTAEPRRASLSRFRSFLWSVMEKKATVRYDAGRFLVRARGAGEAPVGFEGGDARAARDACRRRAPREPGAVEPWFATPRHAPGRVAGRPHSTRVALKTTTRTRDNERMTFENARRVSRVPSLARPSRARARVRAFRLRCRPNARQPKPARRSHARCATYECRPDACGEFSNALPEFCHAPRKSAVGNRRRNETLFMASGGEFCFLMCFLMRLLSIRAGSVPGWRRTPGASRPPHTS